MRHRRRRVAAFPLTAPTQPAHRMFDVAPACLVVNALLAYLNQRFVGRPITIGVRAAALLLSLTLVRLDRVGT